MFDRRAFIEARRDEDPDGRLSDKEIERTADFEQLEWNIANIEDTSDVQSVLFTLVALVRNQ